MHAFRVQYICLIIAFYGFFTFFMLCLYRKHLRDQMDYDDRRRLALIVSETCAAISRRLNVFVTGRSQVGGRAAWKIPRIQNVLDHEFLHFPDRKWRESYRISKDMFEQLTRDLHSLQRQVTRLCNPVPVKNNRSDAAQTHRERIGLQRDWRQIWNGCFNSMHES